MSGLIIPHKGIRPTVAPDAFIAQNATLIGDTTIGAECSIWYGCVLRGDDNPITIGARTNIQDGTVVHVTRGLARTVIGEDVTVGHMVLLHGCVLESACFVGMSSVVMDGCVIETGGMLAAGALLTPGKRIPRGELWAGRPAKFLRHMTDEDMARIPRTRDNYVNLGRQYLAELG